MLATMYACLKGLGFTVYFLFIFKYEVFVLNILIVGSSSWVFFTFFLKKENFFIRKICW